MRLETRHILSYAAGLLFCFSGTAAVATDRPLEGLSITYKPYIEGEGGYDSNPDNSTDQLGSAFEKVEGGLRVIAKNPREYYEFNLKARDIHFNELEREDRWDYRVALDTDFDIGGGQSFKFGSYFLRDFVSENPVDISETYGNYLLKGDAFRFKLLTRSHVEHNLNDDVQGTLPTDVFDVLKNEAFDFARTDGQVSFITFTNTPMQPFLLIDFAKIDYFNQVPGATIDRDAVEGFAVAGMRFEFDKTFRIDVGGRYNNRNFDDLTFRDASRAFIDINAYWKPVDYFSASFVVERFFKEPSTSFGLADDVRTVGVTMDYRFNKYWRLNMAAYYDRVEPVGEDLKFNKYSTTAAITYEPTQNIELFLSGLLKFSNETIEGDSYDRYKIGSGLRYKF